MAALQAWSQAKEKRTAALKHFRLHPCYTSCKRPGRFLLRWGRDFPSRNSLSDKKRSGRPRKLTAATVKRAAEVFIAGYTRDGIQQSFCGINEAIELSPELKSIVTSHNMHPRTLLRNMQAATPTLVKRNEDLKPILSTIQKQQRVNACINLLRFKDPYFWRIFWIDAKTMHISPGRARVWVDSSAPMRVKTDSRMPRSGRDRRTLHFYAMVNWCVGPVAIRFVTGTSGLERTKTYKVGQHPSKYIPAFRL